jgi:hypothetical protein
MSARANHAPGDVPDLPLDPPEYREWEECVHEEKCENEAQCRGRLDREDRNERDAAEERRWEARHDR